MQIHSYNNISFGQKVPTVPLLKMGAEIYDYEAAKNFCMVFDRRFPGHVGYFKKAVGFVQNIIVKNPDITKIINSIKSIEGKEKQIAQINKIASKMGKEIDVVI